MAGPPYVCCLGGAGTVAVTGNGVRDGESGVEADEVLVVAVEDEVAVLVVDGGAEGDDAGGGLAFEFGDGEFGVEGVAGVDGFEEAAGLFDEAYEAVTEDVGKEPGAGGGEGEDLESVGEEAGVAVGVAVGAVVMDGVVVAGEELECGEVGVGDGAGGDGEFVAYMEVVEGFCFG